MRPLMTLSSSPALRIGKGGRTEGEDQTKERGSTKVEGRNLLWSRPGNIVALTWATLVFYGDCTYLENYKKIMTMRKHLITEITAIEELYIIGDPQLSIIAISSDKININVLAEELKKKK